MNNACISLINGCVVLASVVGRSHSASRKPVSLSLIQFFLASVTNVKDLHLSLPQHIHQVIALPDFVLDLLLSLNLCLSDQALFMLKLSLLLHLILPKRLFLFDGLPLHNAFMFKLFLSLKVLTFCSLRLQLLLDPVSLVLKRAQFLLSLPPFLFLLLMHLLPQPLLFIVELLLRLVAHLLHKPLLPYDLILFDLPDPPLFLDLYHLQLLIQLLLAEPLFEARPLRNLLHLLGLLRHGLPDQLALEPLFVVLAPPLLLQDAVSVRLLPLPRLQVRLQLPQRIVRLLLLQQLQQLLVRFELHVRDVLVLKARLEVVLGLPRFLYEFLLCYPSLVISSRRMRSCSIYSCSNCILRFLSSSATPAASCCLLMRSSFASTC